MKDTTAQVKRPHRSQLIYQKVEANALLDIIAQQKKMISS